MDDVADDLAFHEAGLQEVQDTGKKASWRALFNFTTKAHLFPVIAAIALSVISGIVVPALAVFLGKLFDLFTKYGGGSISGHELVHKISRYGLYLVGLGVGVIVLNASYFGFWLLYGELQAKSVRDKLFDGLLEKDLEWFDMRKSGVNTLLSRLQTQTRELQLATSQPLGFTVQYTVTTVAAFGLALYYSWDLTLITLSTVPFAAVILGKLSAGMQPTVNGHLQELTRASKLANSSISSIETVKCYNGQDWEAWQYASAVKNAAIFYLRQARSNALQIGFVRFVTLSMFVQGFWYGTHLVNTGKKTPGAVLTAFWACLMATQTVEQILPQIIVLEKGRAAGATLRATLMRMETGRQVVEMLGRKSPEYCEGDIQIHDLSFRYPARPDHLALDCSSFFFSARETTFIVGRSGSGKSTIGNLLLRFYKPRSGDILVDGNPIQTLDMNWLRNNITLVQQQSVLFNETLFKNIAFGRRDHDRVSREEVKSSMQTAYLQHTVKELPHGLDTVVGFGGSALSGGQKQRVAIARARLRDTPILVIDEGTSALDHISRTIVTDAIRQWRRGKTTIIITHDMSQVKDDDYVYVMDNGRIVQEGFRRALEGVETSAFERLLQPELRFSTYGSMGNGAPRSPSNPFDGSARSPPSPVSPVDEADPMDIRFHPRRLSIPSVFGPGPKDSRQGKALQGPVSPLSPMAFPMHRMSALPTRRKASVFQPLHPHTSPTMPEGKRLSTNFELSGVSTGARRKSDSQGLLTRGSVASSISIASCELTNSSAQEKPQQVMSLKRILYTVWPNLTWRKRMILLCGFACAAVHAAATPMFSWVFAKLLGTFFLPQNERATKALKWSLSVLGVAAVDSTASYFLHYLLEYCGQAWIDTLRVQAMKRVLDQPREWFDLDKNKLTELIECLDRNAEEMRNLLGRFAAFVFVAILMLTMAIIWSLVLCWKLTLVGLACAPAMYAVSQAFETVSGKWEGKSNGAGMVANSIFTETFGNIRTVRALTLERHFHEKYAKATDKCLKVGIKRSVLSGLFFGISDSGIIFITALIFYYGAVVASSGGYSVQDILTVFTMLLFSIANANNLVAFIPQIGSAQDTATRLLRLANLPFHQSHEHAGNVRLPKLGPIEFSGVCFSYPSRPDTSVLKSLKLTVDPHSSTSLVGSSGCGKSTIASLLLGLYPPSSGTIKIASFPINALHLPTLRNLIAVVPQSPTLFAATVAQNIAYGLPERSPMATFRLIQAAAVSAGIDEFIMSLPQGYNTLIGDGGSGLSGGQAQRLAIARAVVRRPELLIMDEATSALDGESARGIYTLVQKLEKVNIGCLVVTHATEMMRTCVECVVLEGGSVVESGRFTDLIGRRHGSLRRLIGG
ncbi:MAG: hypothetical protein Q9191_005111 [Dirinaria sp. TL-2023a]